MAPASKFGQAADAESLQLTDEENQMRDQLKAAWAGILNIDIADDTDFFKSGAGSMHVVRYARSYLCRSAASGSFFAVDKG